MIDGNDIQMGTYLINEDSKYKTGEVAILQVTTYQFGESNSLSSKGSLNDPAPPDTPVYKIGKLDTLDLGTWLLQILVFLRTQV